MCSSRTEKCPLCGKYIKLIDYDLHVSTLACKNDPVPEVVAPRAAEALSRPGPGRARRVTAVAPRGINRQIDRLKKQTEELNKAVGERAPAAARRPGASRRAAVSTTARVSRRPAQPKDALPRNLYQPDYDEIMAREIQEQALAEQERLDLELANKINNELQEQGNLDMGSSVDSEALAKKLQQEMEQEINARNEEIARKMQADIDAELASAYANEAQPAQEERPPMQQDLGEPFVEQLQPAYSEQFNPGFEGFNPSNPEYEGYNPPNPEYGGFNVEDPEDEAAAIEAELLKYYLENS